MTLFSICRTLESENLKLVIMRTESIVALVSCICTISAFHGSLRSNMRAINSHFMSDTEGNDFVIADAPVMPESSAEVDMATGEMGVEGLDLVKLAAEAAEEAFSGIIEEPVEEIVRLAPRQAGWFPMLLSPETLDGTFAGDVGFDPLGLASDSERLLWMREAEIKHARLAMLGAAGWPMSELWHKGIADFLGLDSILVGDGKAPSVLNGGLSNQWIYGAAVLAVLIGGLLEAGAMNREDKSKPGNYGFDPLSLHSFRASFGLDTITEKLSAEEKIARAKFDMDYCEIRHGRLAMLGITGMCLQEVVSGMPVVQQTPFFFGDPIF